VINLVYLIVHNTSLHRYLFTKYISRLHLNDHVLYIAEFTLTYIGAILKDGFLLVIQIRIKETITTYKSTINKEISFK